MSNKPVVKLGFMRYRRVNDILCKDNSLNNMMSQRDQVVMKPNGDKELYPREVVTVTEQLAEEGVDPQHASRQLIMQKAIAVFRIGTGRRPVPTKPERVEKPERVKKPKAPKAVKVKKLRSVPVPAPIVIIAEPDPVAEQPKVEVVPATMSMAQLIEGEPITSLHECAVLPKAIIGQPLEVKKIFAAIQVGWSQLLMALTVLEGKDKLPGYEGRIKRLKDLTSEYEKLNVFEHSCAEESINVENTACATA